MIRQKYDNLLWILLAILAAFFTLSCSDDRTSLGNSAESGNPEIAGVLYFADGSFAARVRVRVVPDDFSVWSDSVDSLWTTWTDSLGRFEFSTLPSEIFTLEAVDSLSGMQLVQMGISKDSERENIKGYLENTGSVRLGAENFADGTTGVLYVPGTTILRPVTVELGNIFVDSLPSDSLCPLIFRSDSGDSLEVNEPVLVVADSVTSVHSHSVSLRFRVPLDMTSSGIALSEDLRNFPLEIRLDSSDYDFRGLERISGAWNAVLCGDTLPLSLSYADMEKGDFTFWTRIAKLRANAKDTLFLSFEENTEASLQSLGNVFSDGFIAAWHFDEGGSTARDATGNGFDGLPEDLYVADEAVAGGALYYDGTQGAVTIPNSATGALDLTLQTSVTFSVWVKMEGLDRSRVVFGKGASQYHLRYLAGTNESSWLYEIFTDEILDSSSNSARYWYMDSSKASEEWTHLAVVQDSSGAALYVNGEVAASSPRIGTSTTVRTTDSLFVIGKLIYPADDPTDLVTHYFKGVIDEFHVSRNARSSAWILTTYQNQNPQKRWPVPEFID